MPEAALRRAVNARMQGRGRERREPWRVHCIKRGEPVREGRECGAERGGRTCWHVREGFLSWRGGVWGSLVSVVRTQSGRRGERGTYVWWGLFACADGVVQARVAQDRLVLRL